MKRFSYFTTVTIFAFFCSTVSQARENTYVGQYVLGEGDVRYLELLDIAYRMFNPDPEFQNVSMLYTPSWNGLVEGPTWDAWWVQNSYGTTYCALPFLQEPYVTFLQNAQDLWFDQMGDGETVRPHRHFQFVPPDGALCDAAQPGHFIAKQGDGRVDIHDWGVEFTAAGLLMQAELLLIGRDLDTIAEYLPKLERCANFLETRRDPKNNLFLGGPASNLLAPSFAGYKKEDGTYGMAYLAGLSVTTIAALDRLIELEKMMDRGDAVKTYSERRRLAKQGLSALTTAEGYFVKSIDPDGTKHGVYGAAKHGYFEASPNHDAIAFRVVDDAQAEKIYQKIASIPGLRPYDFIIANCPGLDDMYVDDSNWLWSFGTWVNGGHWSTCEARMMMGYSRLGKYDDIKRSMERVMTFARKFRMDNPLVEFGSKVYQPKEPINICYDTFGPPAAMIRGTFEYLYDAEGVTLIPHIPPALIQYKQDFPIRLGDKRLYLSTSGSGPIHSVSVNGKEWKSFDSKSVTLPYDKTPMRTDVRIVLGDPSKPQPPKSELKVSRTRLERIKQPKVGLCEEGRKLSDTFRALSEQGLGETYEAAHCSLGLECYIAIEKRKTLKLPSLPKESQIAADQSYVDAAKRIYDGFVKVMNSYADSNDPQKQSIYKTWKEIAE